MYLARSRQYRWLANSLHNITVIRTGFVLCESKMLGLCLNTSKSIAGASILWPCNLPYFRNPIWNNDKFSSSITSPMTAQRNMYCLAYASNFFMQKQLHSGNSSQPVLLFNSFNTERSKTNSRQCSVSWFGCNLFSFCCFWAVLVCPRTRSGWFVCMSKPLVLTHTWQVNNTQNLYPHLM